MSGFEVTGGRLVITKDARTVATTGGTLLQALTGQQTFTANLVFPNATKTRLYMWRYGCTRATGAEFYVTRTARSVVGARAQEWTNTIVLGAAPAGADFFLGRVELTRTVAPSHTWLGQSITPVFTQGVQIPLRGSMLIEQAIGITRSMTLDVQGGNLVAILEHSVGPAAGNFTTHGTLPPDFPPNSTSDNFRWGSENVCEGGGAALPVWWRDDAPYYRNEGQAYSGTLPPDDVTEGLEWASDMRWGGSDLASHDNSPNYSSTYALTARGRFGRRS